VNPESEKILAESSVGHDDAARDGVGMVLGGYEPGFNFVWGSQPESIENFVVLRVKGEPRLLLPAAATQMRTALHNFIGQQKIASLIFPVLNITKRATGPFSFLSSTASLTSADGSHSPLRVLMTQVLQRSDFQLALRLSFSRPNAKTVAMAISDAGEVLCFAKFGSESMTNRLVAHESDVLARLNSTELPVLVPQRLYSGEWAGGFNVLITAPLKLEPLPRDASMAHQAADAFAAQHIVSRSTLADSDYWQQMNVRVARLDDSEELLADMASLEKICGANSFDYGASHGDWSRANVGIAGGQVAAVDWERCTLLAPRGIDIAHFAIFEKPTARFSRALDIEQLASVTGQYLEAAGQSPANARALTLLALLEMVVRFKTAQNVAIKSTDSKFGPALKAGLQKWSV